MNYEWQIVMLREWWQSMGAMSKARLAMSNSEGR